MEPMFGRRTVLLLLAVLLLISIGLRYPLVEHERLQTDSYFIHGLAKSISDDGRAEWTLSPLSYFGYYPLSYPSGTPFVIAEVSSLTGASIEFSILLVDMLLSMLFCLGVFVMARSFVTQDRYVILATLFAILAPRFVDTTYWDASARGPMVVLIIITVFAFFRAAQMGQKNLRHLGLLLTLGCFVTHHMAILLVLFGIAYVVASFQVNFILPRITLRRRAWAAAFNGVVGLSILLVASRFYDQWKELAIMGTGETALFSSGPEAVVILLNVGVSYVHQMGFVILVALVGIPTILKESRLSATSLFLIALVLAFLPVLSRSIYISMLLTPFVAVTCVYWISKQFARPSRKKATAILVVLLAVGSVILPIWSVERWNGVTYVGGYTVEVDSQVFSDAAYLNVDYAGRYAVSNAKAAGAELAVASDAVFLGSGIQLLINGEITIDDVKANSSWTTSDFPTNLYSWFEYSGDPKVDYYVYLMMVQGIGFVVHQNDIGTETGRYLADHRNLLVVIDNDHPTSYVDGYSIHGSVFASELRSATWTSSFSGYQKQNEWSSYLIYSSGQTSYYLAQLPL